MSFYDAPKQSRALAAVIGVILLAAVGVVIVMSTAVSRVSTQDEEPTGDVATGEETNEDQVAITANYAAIKTNLGDIIIQLYPDDAPKTVKNFATLAQAGFYNNLLFHRVAKDFVIQGGDPQGDGSGGKSIYGEAFEDEINADSLELEAEVKDLYQALYGYKYRTDITSHKLEVGSVAMANRGANTNTSQFFIVSKEAQPKLDGKHTVFGKVIDGMSTVETINNVAVGGNERPVDPVVMQKIVVGDSEDEVRSKISDNE